GWALWKSDGTAAGTVLVNLVSAWQLANVNGTLFFYDSGSGDLSKSDGTAAGTVKITTIPPISWGASQPPIVSAGREAFFLAGSVSGASQLWETDGTAAGT